MRLSARLHDNLFGFGTPEDPRAAYLFRGLELFVVGCAIWLSAVWGLYIRHLPFISTPAGLAQHIDLSVLCSDLALVNAAGIGGLVLMGFFRRGGRWTYGVALVLFHLQYVARFSLGKTPHGANYIGMTLLALALALLFFRGRRRQRRFTLGFLYFFLGLGYVLAAACKLISSGLAWSDGHHLWMWMTERQVDRYATYGLYAPSVLQEALRHSHPLATALLTVGLATELLGWLMWWRRTRLAILAALIGLHLGITVTLDIHFPLYVIELALLGGLAWLDQHPAPQHPAPQHPAPQHPASPLRPAASPHQPSINPLMLP